ncbi:RelA/SpoT domain-containing protein [Parvularcula flava]|uniref:RelA/SpoT domain-containing protein n=1 Tax=Aquisalinus luteolus TaxID=1566827 RepID=A0A8J3EP97_9PROT|nr:RelA/SpoT domain-containing protein [Aquisalinus luteolus]NHK27507.1 RelA/SpoT domain-containing protein [Aquisalinus luteolus]GGH95646.1 hypothetical protein GCM10011355_12680 [Aquisalinus luteolus]
MTKQNQSCAEAKSVKEQIDSSFVSFGRLKAGVHSMVETLLQTNSINYLSVHSRLKTKDAILEKISRKEYPNGFAGVSDVVGIRVIVFFNRQVNEAIKLLRNAFEVVEDETSDRGRDLGKDKIGYRSFHLVCRLGSSRGGLPEYSGLDQLKFEIQVRTVLQHAWAELAHDTSYKFSAELPSEIERKLNLYSGLLEVADNGLEEIAVQISQYEEEINNAKTQDFSVQNIDSITFSRALREAKMTYGFELSSTSDDQKIITELNRFGVEDVGELEALISDVMEQVEKKGHDFPYSSDVAFVRTLMLVKDCDRYFSESWKKAWSSIDRTQAEFLFEMCDAARIKGLFNEHGISIYDVDPRVKKASKSTKAKSD